MVIACGLVLADDRSDGTWLRRPYYGAAFVVMAGCSRLLAFINRVRQALRIRLDIPPDIPVAVMSREFHGVVHPLLIGHFAQHRMAQDVWGDDEMLIGRQMGIRLPGDAFQDQKGLRAVEPLAAPGQKDGSRPFAPLPQPRIEHVSLLSLDGDEPLHVPTLPQDMHKPPLVILRDIDSEELGHPEARA